MKEILIFAGTTEGRELSEYLAGAGIAHTLCVATEYGEIVQKEHPLVKIHKGRMNQREIEVYIKTGNFGAVVDATHPYAEVVTQNIKNAMQDMDIPYLRLKRENNVTSAYEKIQYFKDSISCTKALKNTDGNILLTTGSKELSVFSELIGRKERLYVRVLPAIESLQVCMDCGIAGKQILALQGPFSVQMNEAMFRQYQIKCLVTKASGNAGGYQEKLDAAQNMGIPVFVIGCPEEEGGYTFEEIICWITKTKPLKKMLTHGKADGEFIRDKVPMTKEEIREVSVCKLKLYAGAVVYDIGSGTGSVAAEIAGLSEEIKVFAVDYKAEAISLIARNKEKFGLDNIEIVSTKAPEGLEELPSPTHAFIGGSSGKMKEILSVLYHKNSQMRVVINAISMETICEIKEALSMFSIQNADVVQMQVSRAKSAGMYHLMQAENPVWICAFDFCG